MGLRLIFESILGPPGQLVAGAVWAVWLVPVPPWMGDQCAARLTQSPFSNTMTSVALKVYL